MFERCTVQEQRAAHGASPAFVGLFHECRFRHRLQSHLSSFSRDSDGLEAEVCVGNLDAARSSVFVSSTRAQLNISGAPDCAAASCADGGGHTSSRPDAVVDVISKAAAARSEAVIATIHACGDRIVGLPGWWLSLVEVVVIPACSWSAYV